MAPIEIVNRGDISEDSGTWAKRITRLPQVERLVAIGDFHGDYEKAKKSLKLANVMDEEEKWIGGETVVVQVGDILDRGQQELDILILLEKLQKQAIQAGGQIITLLGNHEIMNMEGDLSYVTQSALQRFDEYKKTQIELGLNTQQDFSVPDTSILSHYQPMQSRLGALKPGGPVTKRFFGNSPAVLQVGTTVFVHAGLKAEHVKYGLERINRETRDWLLGRAEYVGGYPSSGPQILTGDMRNGILFMRNYSVPTDWIDFQEMLDNALGSIRGAKRMVVGHTPQHNGKIKGYYEGKVYAVDVGMSAGISGCEPEVLEIVTLNKTITLTVLNGQGKVSAAARKVKLPTNQREVSFWRMGIWK